MTLEGLGINIKSILTAASSDPIALAKAKKSAITSLSQWWARYATTYWEHRVNIKGWKTHYIRASRLVFVSYLIRQSGTVDAHFIAQSTKDLPQVIVKLVADWLRENKPRHKVSGNPKRPETITFGGPVFEWFEHEIKVRYGSILDNHSEIMAYASVLKGDTDAHSRFMAFLDSRAL